MQCKLARAFYASLSRALYPFQLHSLSIYCSRLHNSTYSSTSPPSRSGALCCLARLAHIWRIAISMQNQCMQRSWRQRRRRLRYLAQGQLATHQHTFPPETRDRKRHPPTPPRRDQTRGDAAEAAPFSQNSQWQFFICELRSTAKCEKINIDPDTHSIYTTKETGRERERDANNNNKNKHCKVIFTLSNIQKWRNYRKIKQRKYRKLYLGFLHSANGKLLINF